MIVATDAELMAALAKALKCISCSW